MSLVMYNADPLSAARKLVTRLQTVLTPDRIAATVQWPAARVELFFPPSFRASIALRNKDPLAKVEHTARLIDSDLRPESLAEALRWPRKRVEDTFGATELAIAVRSHADPVEHLKRAARSLDTTLSTANLMKEFGWTQRQVDALFSKSVRTSIAIRTANPLEAAKRIVLARKEMMLRHPTLPSEIINFVACRHIGRFRKVAQLLENEAANVPSNRNQHLWLWSVAHLPNAGEEAWRERYASYELYLWIFRPTSLDTGGYGGSSLHRTTASSAESHSYDSAEFELHATDSDVLLSSLAEESGVSQTDFQALLAYFAANAAVTLSGEQQKTFNKLRQAAKEHGYKID